MVAPHTNRSGTARSITTRSPIWVEEVDFDDGTTGFADRGHASRLRAVCRARPARRPPELSSRASTTAPTWATYVTYSGTVAAAFEGIVLGIPAVAVSQQAGVGGMGYAGREYDFEHSAGRRA